MSRIILFSLVFLSFGRALSAEQQRGLWVVRYALEEDTEISRIIGTAEELSITDLYVQVRALGDNLFERTTGSEATVKRLQSLISEAHKNQIRVHAWINMMYIWAGNRTPDSGGHVFFTSPMAILRTAYQKDIPAYRDIRSENIEGYFIHPTDPVHLDEIRRTVGRLMSHFSFDGIHLDYFRLPSLKYSFSPLGRTRFIQNHFIDPVKVYADPERFIVQRGKDSYLFADIVYKDFIRQELTVALSHIRDIVATGKDNFVLSIAVKPDPINARHQYFQDWAYWLQEGLCDQVLIMNYTTDFDAFKLNLIRAGDTGMPGKIVVGIATYNQGVREVKRRIFMVNHLDFAGIALFSYNHLAEEKQYLNSLSLVLGKGAQNVGNDPRTKGN